MDSYEINNWVAVLQKELAKKPDFLLQAAKTAEEWITEAKNAADVISKTNYSNANKGKLLADFNGFCKKYENLMACAYSYIVINKFYPELVLEIVTKHEKDPHKHGELLACLLSLNRKTGIKEERISLIEIAKSIAEGKEPDMLIKNHVNKFAYLGHYVFYGESYTPKKIKERADEIVSNGIGQELLQMELQQKRLLRGDSLKAKWVLSKSELLKIESVRAWAFISNESDEMHGYSFFYARNLFGAIASKLGITIEQLIEMTDWEIKTSLNSEKPLDAQFKKKLAIRYADSALILEGGGISLLEGSELEKYRSSQFSKEREFGHIQELKGQGASPGKVIGKVALILSITEISKVKRGDILVASSTMPAFVPAMEKAAAIVTNEGGLLSHAAIISREFGKPCVVGTKIATKVLKDGDLVEVDANKGTVRKIK
ncbi:hypothetical protein HY989_01465 [Candidatus Micrarchaeota archaeon]|nr:hypothetical protein [Candidatus Micrarchaeota archaeon]